MEIVYFYCYYFGREKSGLLRVSAYILPAASRDAAGGLGETQAVTILHAFMVASAGGTDRDLAAPQFRRN
jgi:hypothetical protein